MTSTYSTQQSLLTAQADHDEQSAHYESNRNHVLAVLGRRCSWLDPSDREALWHDAFLVFLEKVRRHTLDASSMADGQVRAYLTETALHKAMDEGKRAERRYAVALDDNVRTELPAHDTPTEDRVAASFDHALLREIVSELPSRQQQILVLRFFFDHTPEQIQRQLGISARMYRRDLERGTRAVAKRLAAVRAGTYCEERRGAIVAYVAGIAGPRRSASIRRHLANCAACAHTAAELRVTGLRACSTPIPAR